VFGSSTWRTSIEHELSTYRKLQYLAGITNRRETASWCQEGYAKPKSALAERPDIYIFVIDEDYKIDRKMQPYRVLVAL
jgi:hypothetical protein